MKCSTYNCNLCCTCNKGLAGLVSHNMPKNRCEFRSNFLVIVSIYVPESRMTESEIRMPGFVIWTRLISPISSFWELSSLVAQDKRWRTLISGLWITCIIFHRTRNSSPKFSPEVHIGFFGHMECQLSGKEEVTVRGNNWEGERKGERVSEREREREREREWEREKEKERETARGRERERESEREKERDRGRERGLLYYTWYYQHFLLCYYFCGRNYS